MGLFDKIIKKEASPEVVARIHNSECAQECVKTFCKIFSEGDSHLNWLMANSKKRMLTMKIMNDGVYLIQIDRTQGRPTDYGGYDYSVGRESWSFGASGYSDLPSKEYLTAFVQYLYVQIKNKCPDVELSKRTIIFT